MSSITSKDAVSASIPPKCNFTTIFFAVLNILALPIHLQFTAGAVAGVSEILFMYPLDGNQSFSLICNIMIMSSCKDSVSIAKG